MCDNEGCTNGQDFILTHSINNEIKITSMICNFCADIVFRNGDTKQKLVSINFPTQ